MSTDFERILATASDAELNDAVITRIQGANWKDDLGALNAEEATFVRVYAFSAVADNGGLAYVLETGGPYGLDATYAALERVGLLAIARALAMAATLPLEDGKEGAEAPPAARDVEKGRLRRAARLREDDALCARVEEPLWASHDLLPGALAAFVRAHREAFMHLAGREPFDPSSR